MALFRMRALGIRPGETWDFGLHATGSISTPDAATAWSAALSNAWASDWAQYYSVSTVLNTASVALLDMGTGRQSARSDLQPDAPGTDTAGTLIPPQCAVVCSFRSTLANRSGRGRWYLPAPTTTANLNGEIIAAAQTAFLNGAVLAFGNLNDSGLTPVIYHRPGSPLAGTTTNINQIIVDSIFDTQRRRRDKLVGTSVSTLV